MQGIDELIKVSGLRANGVLSDEEYDKLRYRLMKNIMKPNQAPAWMKPLGCYFTCVAIAGLGLIAWVEPSRSELEPLLIKLATNPLFFLVLPFGAYWLWRSDAMES